MWTSLATAHAQTLHFGWAYNRAKKPLCKNFEAKEGMGVYSQLFEEISVSSDSVQDGLIFARVRYVSLYHDDPLPTV